MPRAKECLKISATASWKQEHSTYTPCTMLLSGAHASGGGVQDLKPSQGRSHLWEATPLQRRLVAIPLDSCCSSLMILSSTSCDACTMLRIRSQSSSSLRSTAPLAAPALACVVKHADLYAAHSLSSQLAVTHQQKPYNSILSRICDKG